MESLASKQTFGGPRSEGLSVAWGAKVVFRVRKGWGAYYYYIIQHKSGGEEGDVTRCASSNNA